MSDMLRGENAQLILENPEFVSAFDDIERGIVDRWKATGVSDTEGQRYLKLLLKIHHDYRSTLQARINSGKMEEVKIKREGIVSNMFRR